jgi:SAM-dependent methyltransferase
MSLRLRGRGRVSSSPLIFDRRLLRARRARAAALGPCLFLLQRAAEDLSERLASIVRHFDRAVDLGTPGEGLAQALIDSNKVGVVIRAHESALRLRGLAVKNGTGHRRDPLAIAADEEALPFRAGSIDLFVSALSLQFVNDLPGALAQIRRALKPDGLLLAALAGGDTLTELRQSFAAAEAEVEDGVSPRVIPFVDVRQAGALLQRTGFAMPVTDVDRLVVRYASPLALMHDLRRMGAGNPLRERSRRPLRRATLQRMMEIYAERFADTDGRIPATFEIVWLAGWAPDDRGRTTEDE